MKKNEDLFDVDNSNNKNKKVKKESLLVNDELGFAKTINKTLFEP